MMMMITLSQAHRQSKREMKSCQIVSNIKRHFENISTKNNRKEIEKLFKNSEPIVHLGLHRDVVNLLMYLKLLINL